MYYYVVVGIPAFSMGNFCCWILSKFDKNWNQTFNFTV